ncbi:MULTISPECIES: 1,4-dihydroxy-2-naphthoate polyprenyltransferase [unclassified Gilliamella]|uniref:1,4-dihydroxy-2-naphthoate polyprenyltransferase n=1 Tax=unclassified Gilliamella TaxID=2685620 RepID=UPI002269DDDB|nr:MULTISPECIES: 1,4-dihydroxy-2-naphthoate polyprenyltransferase [unclassified Gilliamella]MCX8656328.1 1,4-dihydroxy-2-naphthoate polyprenyltransferase [Gilliamella sp. B2894]MCX8665171.1 1,4-dihydroxy-2-naphthoate polyprenyltransferase [Gilliamella sp. B2887]MCX8693609.1 1,4-dihydroxy-2-naphthoate polyprenyltransferase [Gilliamella sp. B2881]MCX8696353.1 1,4-dihydroxy-2-naphthoate polyprenyltransferase [Gilliamella sp. B2828]MCX8697753.1 1,4-dihydroxy-2-naphthoate polyprenyltransferase [Gil
MPNKYYPWIISLRPKTLVLSLCAILMGNALAYWQGSFDPLVMLLSMITASLLQILSNLANDYGDVIKGSDKQNLAGHKRGLQLGLITLNQLKKALWINIFLCILFGLILIIFACNNIYELFSFILLGLLSIIAAITYTVGKKPYGYIGLGDLSVLIFFGLISVIGSYYLQTNALSMPMILPALGCGLLSVAVLNINNLRDIDSDRMNHKRTLVVLIGKEIGRFYHLLLLMIAICSFSLFTYSYLQTYWGWLFMFSLPWLIRHIYAVFQFKTAKDAFPLLLQMVKLALLINLLYCLGIIMS